ncbi:unnamed protein product, partial [marine sediment metagenome]
KYLTDSEIQYLLSAEVIFQWTDQKRFMKGMEKINTIIKKLTEDQKFSVARFLALIIYRNRILLAEINSNLKKSERREISHIANWTGLKLALIFHFISDSTKEDVVQSVWKDTDAAIDDMILVRDFYRQVVQNKEGMLDDLEKKDKMQYRIQCANKLVLTHTNVRKSASPLVSLQLTLHQDLSRKPEDEDAPKPRHPDYVPGYAPTLDNEDLKDKLNEGERIRTSELVTVEHGDTT